uniref:Putative stigma-specific stig1-like protein 1 n=1 Tax=Lupinus angustifolius TaxID=3871 RepID=A0A182BFF9_LUPAN|nr:putative stigma-specific stig1-like protein 1 [Lupinus angustifolius]
MTLQAQSLAFVTLLVLLLLVMIIKIEGKLLVYDYGNDINVSEVNDEEGGVNKAAPVKCRNRPFACSKGEFPPRFMCCKNHCVDVTSNTSNCGLCGIRCRFNFKCCNYLCVNTNINPLNCGRCGRVCPFGRLCLFGLCAFQEPSPLPPPLTEPPTSMPHQNASQVLNHQYLKDPSAME